MAYQRGSENTAGWISEMASSLDKDFPNMLDLMTSTVMTTETSAIVLDLVAITKTAVVIGLDHARAPELPEELSVVAEAFEHFQSKQGFGSVLPIYPCWLDTDGERNFTTEWPVLHDAQDVYDFIAQVSEPETSELNVGLHNTGMNEEDSVQRNTTPIASPIYKVATTPESSDRDAAGLMAILVPPFKRSAHRIQRNFRQFMQPKPIQPIQINRKLIKTMWQRDTMRIDAEGHKMIPNKCLIELNPYTYQEFFAPLVSRLREQWQKRIAVELAARNQHNRSFREYDLSWPLEVELQPADDVPIEDVRITCKHRQSPHYSAFLESHDGHQWPLAEPVTTLGRSADCMVEITSPEATRVSRYHAHIRQDTNELVLRDGAIDGTSSTNGTFINRRPIGPTGQVLKDGDEIILGRCDLGRPPQPDDHGVASFIFRLAKS